MDEKQALALRHPFPKSAIGHLPKGGITLDFVGHAATTDRLLQVDPSWTWAPLAHGQDGLPQFDANGGLWIQLTVAGVTRLGYGDAAGKKGANAVKEAIGDAIRNAAMRFGVALDLWTKEDLQGDGESPAASLPSSATADAAGDEHKRATEAKSTITLREPDQEFITDGQFKKLGEIAGPKGYKMSGDQFRDVIEEAIGTRDARKIKRYQFDAVLKAVELAGRGIEA